MINILQAIRLPNNNKIINFFYKKFNEKLNSREYILGEFNFREYFSEELNSKEYFPWQFYSMYIPGELNCREYFPGIILKLFTLIVFQNNF